MTAPIRTENRVPCQNLCISAWYPVYDACCALGKHVFNPNPNKKQKGIILGILCEKRFGKVADFE